MEYLVLLTRAAGTQARVALRRASWGDVITGVRVGPDGKLYQLASSPTTGTRISRFSLGAGPGAR